MVAPGFLVGALGVFKEATRGVVIFLGAFVIGLQAIQVDLVGSCFWIGLASSVCGGFFLGFLPAFCFRSQNLLGFLLGHFPVTVDVKSFQVRASGSEGELVFD